MKRLLLLVAVILGGACQKKAEEPRPASHPPMSANEKDRAGELCARYVARVCGCAEKDPSLREACELSRGQPEAVRMHLDVLHGAPLAELTPSGEVRDAAPGAKRGPLNDEERRLTESSMRKVVAACVKLDADLDPARCPRNR